MITSIYIKTSDRKCSASEYCCFDIYDQDMNKIEMEDCDNIAIKITDVKFSIVGLEIGIENGMIHIWSHDNLDFVPLLNTFLIELKGEKDYDK